MGSYYLEGMSDGLVILLYVLVAVELVDVPGSVVADSVDDIDIQLLGIVCADVADRDDEGLGRGGLGGVYA